MASVESIISTYTYLPSGLVKLLRITSEYYANTTYEPNKIADITIQYGTGGSTSGSGDEGFIVTIPNLTGTGKIPMGDLSQDGTGENYTKITPKLHPCE